MDKPSKLRAILDPSATATVEGKHRRYVPEDACGDARGPLQAYPRLYAFLHDVITPTMASESWSDFLPDPGEGIVVNLGCGAQRLHAEMINVDRVSFPAVDILADFSKALPIQSDAVDALVSIAVLEHVPDPQLHVAEMERVLRPGGLVYVAAPFIYPFHAAPTDYSRWTLEGLKRMFVRFEVVHAGNRGGAAGALILLLSHLAGQILCFGSYRLYSLVSMGAMAAFSPLKLLDLALARLPFSTTLCPNMYLVARKPAPGP
jgi:SAM-dependent methyltransferase